MSFFQLLSQSSFASYAEFEQRVRQVFNENITRIPAGVSVNDLLDWAYEERGIKTGDDNRFHIAVKS